jgi:hypothetical protein
MLIAAAWVGEWKVRKTSQAAKKVQNSAVQNEFKPALRSMTASSPIKHRLSICRVMNP